MAYVRSALRKAQYTEMEDGTFFGKIPSCRGAVAFGKTRRECAKELRSTLKDWIYIGKQLGHEIPNFK
ncbi:MAG: type II toxin-antitoxin system HicB family antitoxin [Pyrinomonadaceae bacterium]